MSDCAIATQSITIVYKEYIKLSVITGADICLRDGYH